MPDHYDKKKKKAAKGAVDNAFNETQKQPRKGGALSILGAINAIKRRKRVQKAYGGYK